MRLSPVIETRSTGNRGEIEGYASVFDGSPDAYGDIIAAGAFSASLSTHKAAGRMPPLLWAHDQAAPIGIWQDMSEDSRGLHVRGRILTETSAGRDAFELVRQKAVTGLSIGFTLPDGTTERTSVGRRLHQIDLHEVSVVAIPANPAARITEVRSFGSPREVEEVLRNSGLSKRQARALLAKGWDGLAKDADPEHSAEISALLNKINRRSAEMAARLKKGLE